MVRSHNITRACGYIGVSMIALSACAPRGSVTQTPANNAYANSAGIGVNGQELYQTSSLSPNIAPQPLVTSALPALSKSTLPAVDYTATGAINKSLPQKPMPIAQYNNGYSAISPTKPQTHYTPKSETPYTVQVGDTIYSIGRKFNTHPGEIIARNSIPNPNNLNVGQSFMIPTSGNYTAVNSVNPQSIIPTNPQNVPPFPITARPSQSASSVSQTYTVQPSDTVYSIGRKLNVNPNYIISKNPTMNPSQLAPGQVLNIPSGNTAQTNQINMPTDTPKETPYANIAKVDNNTHNIMGNTNKTDNLDKEILSNALSLPVKGSIKENKNLRGILISADDGEAVKASAAGEVIYVGNLNNYGNMVLVRHNNGLVTNYARLKKTFVQKGQHVNKGDLIAAAGVSKDFKTSDVLFEVRKGTQAVNPLDYIG